MDDYNSLKEFDNLDKNLKKIIMNMNILSENTSDIEDNLSVIIQYLAEGFDEIESDFKSLKDDIDLINDKLILLEKQNMGNSQNNTLTDKNLLKSIISDTVKESMNKNSIRSDNFEYKNNNQNSITDPRNNNSDRERVGLIERNISMEEELGVNINIVGINRKKEKNTDEYVRVAGFLKVKKHIPESDFFCLNLIAYDKNYKILDTSVVDLYHFHDLYDNLAFDTGFYINYEDTLEKIVIYPAIQHETEYNEDNEDKEYW